MDKSKAQTAFHIITALKQLNRVRNILNMVLTDTEDGNISIGSKALEEEDYFETTDKNIIRDIRIGLDIRISDLDKELESL